MSRFGRGPKSQVNPIMGLDVRDQLAEHCPAHAVNQQKQNGRLFGCFGDDLIEHLLDGYQACSRITHCPLLREGPPKLLVLVFAQFRNAIHQPYKRRRKILIGFAST